MINIKIFGVIVLIGENVCFAHRRLWVRPPLAPHAEVLNRARAYQTRASEKEDTCIFCNDSVTSPTAEGNEPMGLIILEV